MPNTSFRLNSRLVLIIFSLFLSVVLLIGLLWTLLLGGEIPTGAIGSQTCGYYGKSYQDGDNFPAGDGCNTCFCNNGSVGCTEIFCNVPEIDDL